MDLQEKDTNAKKSAAYRVNKKIRDYCAKFGGNRDLEKLLRTHSSSNSSNNSQCSEHDSALCSALDRLFLINNPELNSGFSGSEISPRSVQIREILPNENVVGISNAVEVEADHFLKKTSDAAVEPNISAVDIVKNQDVCHKPLEWDSLGDIGYKKAMSMSNISSLERSVLKDFRQDERSKGTNQDGIRTQIKTGLTSSQLVNSYSEKWRQTLESIKRKYSTQPLASSTLVEAKQSFQKLPRIPLLTSESSLQTKVELEKEYITANKDRSDISNEKHEIEENHSRTEDNEATTVKHSQCHKKNLHQENWKLSEKYSEVAKHIDASIVDHLNSVDSPKPENVQTNQPKMVSQEVQVNVHSNSSSTVGSLLTPSSFEYRSFPSKQKQCSTELSKKRILQAINSNYSSTKSSRSTSTINAGCLTERSLSSSNYSKPECNKENTNSISQLSQGVKLLCSLIDTQNLNRKQKKKLVRDIVAKMCKISSTSSNSSELSALSMNSLIKNLPLSEISSLKSEIEMPTKEVNTCTETDVTQKRDAVMQTKTVITSSSSLPTNLSKTKSVCKEKCRQQNHSIEREWLSPMTQSELDYEEERSRKQQNSDTKSSSQSLNTKSEIKKLRAQVEKCIQLNWIEMEIKRLENLKTVLLKEESETSGRKPKSSSSISTQKTDTSVDAPSHRIYDTVHSEKSSSFARTSNQYNAEKIIEQSSEDIDNIVDKYKRSIKRIKETNTIYDRPLRSDDDGPSKPIFSKQTITTKINEEQRIPNEPEEQATAPKECKTSKSHRSKMNTPAHSTENESVGSFVEQRKKQFLDQWNDKNMNNPSTFPLKQKKRNVNQQPHTYSEPRSVQKLHKTHYCAGQPPSTYATSTSTIVSSSMFCISSEISIPVMTTSCTSITTSHQQDDTRCGVSVQTGDSLMRTRPIFGPDRALPINQHTKRTRAYPGKNQVVQVQPQALSYMITFDSNHETNTRNKKSEIQVNVNEPPISLQEQLYKARPEFFVHAQKRQETLNKLHTLQQQRNREIRDIIENTSLNSIPRKLEKLPPPPTKYTRIFRTKEMKSITKKRYAHLPEVIEKAEKEKNEKQRKSNRLLKDLFNKNLQKRVHNGKLSLNHSGTVI